MNDDQDVTKELNELISVTDVSSEVLEELSQLFASQTEDLDTEVAVVITEQVEQINVVNVVEVIEDSEVIEAPIQSVVQIGDPLLTASRDSSGVVQIFDDGQGALVIDAVDVDRIVIVDQDRPDPTFEERQRRRVRRERLKKVKWLKLSGIGVGAIVVVMAVLASPLFAIRTVSFEGVVYTAPKTVELVQKTLKGASVFTVDIDRARTLLLEDPWVSDVRITTSFPGSAIVEISERSPVVWYVADDQKARIIDARGHVIAVLEGWPTEYVQVRGSGPSLAGGAVANDAYRAAAQLVLALPSEIRPKVESLDLSPGGELSMNLTGGTIVRFGPPVDLQEKLVAVVVLLRRQDPSTLAVLDVSTGEPTVKLR